MRYLPLVWAGMWRRPRRTVLCMLSIANAFLLFAFVTGFAAGLQHAASKAHADTLLTFSRISGVDPLPMALMQQIQATPGIAAVAPVIQFQSTYQKPTQLLRAYGVDIDRYLAVNPQFTVTDAQRQAMKGLQSAALVGDELARHFGWKVGDRVPLQPQFWTNRAGGAWPVDVVGIYGSRDPSRPAHSVLVNYDFVDKGRTLAQGTANYFMSRVGDPTQLVAAANAIDGRFANSPHETRTSTERQLAQDSVRQIGDIGLIVRAVVGATFFALLFSVGSVLMHGVRERTAELAVMKTLGFADEALLWTVMSEAVLLCVISASLGLGVAALLAPVAGAVTGFVVLIGPIVLSGLGLAVLLAVVSGLPPALRAMRLRVVDALSGR